MATATAPAVKRDVKEWMYSWEGRDRGGKLIKGDMKASGEAVVQSTLRRQGINVLKIKRQSQPLPDDVKELPVTLPSPEDSLVEDGHGATSPFAGMVSMRAARGRFG